MFPFYRPYQARRWLLPETFYSLILEKSVYYKMYFTIDNPDTEGQLIFPIIILLRYNVVLRQYFTEKMVIIGVIWGQKCFLKG